MAFEAVKENLEKRGYTVKVFATGAEAAAYLNSEIDGVTVGIGSRDALLSLYKRHYGKVFLGESAGELAVHYSLLSAVGDNFKV